MIFVNAVRGLCMALADSVPGVSGGTIAFLLGFYDRFISALDDLIHGRGAVRMDALKFLLQLGVGWAVGMALAIVVLTEVFESHIYIVSSLFIGFILFAVPLVIHEEREVIYGRWYGLICTVLGIAFVAVVSSVNPASGGMGGQGAAGLLYVFLGGIVSISAMVLPGISGSTLLLIMGLYLPVITAARQIMGFDWTALPVVIAFGLGVCCGVVLVIRLLRYLLEKYRSQMIFLIIGLMLGSLYSVVLGPTTLDVPRPALSWETFHLPAFLIGGGVIFGLQGVRVWMSGRPRGGKRLMR